MTNLLHLIWEYLASRDVEADHRIIFRTAARCPITGDPITAWRRA